MNEPLTKYITFFFLFQTFLLQGFDVPYCLRLWLTLVVQGISDPCEIFNLTLMKMLLEALVRLCPQNR